MIQSIRPSSGCAAQSGGCATFLNATRIGSNRPFQPPACSTGPRDSGDPQRKTYHQSTKPFRYHRLIPPSLYGQFLPGLEECVPSRGHRDGVARIRFSAMVITLHRHFPEITSAKYVNCARVCERPDWIRCMIFACTRWDKVRTFH